MDIQKNSRQVPRAKTIMRDKNYFDLVYAWFQCQSDKDNEFKERIISVKKATYTAIAKDCNIDRRSAAKYVRRLVELGLLKKDESGDNYFLTLLPKDAATLVPFPTLRQLVNSLNRNSVSLYTYLLNKYMACEEKAFQETYFNLKSQIGLSVKTKSNNIIIRDILDILQRLGLLTFELRQVEVDKIILLIKSVTNVLK